MAPCPDAPAEDVLTAYAQRKEAYLDTAALCIARGLRFLLIIAEAHGGGWGSHLRAICADLADRQRAREPTEGSSASLRIAQRISIGLAAEAARALLRRLGEPAGSDWFEAPGSDPGVALGPDGMAEDTDDVPMAGAALAAPDPGSEAWARGAPDAADAAAAAPGLG